MEWICEFFYKNMIVILMEKSDITISLDNTANMALCFKLFSIALWVERLLGMLENYHSESE